MKIKIYIFICLASILFALDFIPVKFAHKGTDMVIDNEKYVFCYEPKTIGNEIVNWVAYGYEDNKINWDTLSFQVNIYGKNPYGYFTERDFEPIDLYNSVDGSNKFILRGKMQKILDGNGYWQINMTIDGWDIVYPINRLSIRRFYVPKSYLTLYDYDLVQVIKGCLGDIWGS